MRRDWTKSGVDLHLDLDAEPLGRRAALEQALRRAVRDGSLVPGARLPASRVLAADLGVARGTVTAAYAHLVAEGYLSARSGAGTVVAAVPWNRGRQADGDGAPAPAGPRHDLRPGRPDVTSFPVEQWLRAARRVLPRVEAAAFAVGDPRGHPELRTALAEYLGRTRGVTADPGAIVVTAGFMQGVGLLARVLADQGCAAVAMEDPCVPMHREAVRRAGPRVVPLPVDGHGAAPPVPQDAGCAVITPAHQSVLGSVLSPARRRAFADWARTGAGLLVEDDYDGEFRYGRQPVGALQAMAPEHIAYLGSVSKTLSPALRLGWMVLPRRLVGPVAEAKYYADVQTDVIGQLVLAELIRTHAYDRHVRSRRLRYRSRRDELMRRLAHEVPEVKARGAAAGLHLTLELPAGGVSEAEVTGLAAARGLALLDLGRSWHGPGTGRPTSVTVGYATPADHAYGAALDALCVSLRAAVGRPAG